MTNAEAAAHFAALPPTEEATIAAIDFDSNIVEIEPLMVADTVIADLPTYDDGVFGGGECSEDELAKAKGKLCITQEW